MIVQISLHSLASQEALYRELAAAGVLGLLLEHFADQGQHLFSPWSHSTKTAQHQSVCISMGLHYFSTRGTEPSVIPHRRSKLAIHPAGGWPFAGGFWLRVSVIQILGCFPFFLPSLGYAFLLRRCFGFGRCFLQFLLCLPFLLTCLFEPALFRRNSLFLLQSGLLLGQGSHPLVVQSIE